MLFFSFSTSVLATDYDKMGGSTDLYYYCKESSNCIPLCVYSCDSGSDPAACYGAKTYQNGEISFIGRYYSNGGEFVADEDNIYKIWEVGALVGGDFFNGFSSSVANLYSWRGEILPTSKTINTYSDLLNSKNWVDSDVYNKTKNNLECPKYFHTEPYNELTESINSVLDPQKIYFFSDGASVALGMPLTYSFIDDFSYALEQIEEFKMPAVMKVDWMNEYLKSLRNAGSNNSYNDSLSAEQNVQNFCQSLVGKSESQFIQDVDMEKFLNDRLSLVVQKLNLRNANVYNFKSLKSILVDPLDPSKKVVDENGKAYIDRLTDAYANVQKSAFKYLNETCSLNLDTAKVDEAIESAVYEKVQLGLNNDVFDCDTLFGGEIAELISGAYFVIEIISILILIVFSVLDYSKVILNGESDEIKKSNQKLMKRLIIVVVIFLLPALVNTVLRVFNIEGFNSDHPLCVKISND